MQVPTASNVQEPLAARPRPRLVLMMPLRRCGSHALRVRLNASPDFYAPYPLHIVDFLPLVPLYGNLEDDERYFNLVRDVVGLQAASPVKWPNVVFDPVDVFEATKAQRPRSVHRVVGELLLRAGEAHNATVVLDKSLDTVHQAEELLSIYPDMLFLNVVHDPRGQVASMNKAIIHDFDSELIARIWVKAYEAAQAFVAKYPSQVLTIRFEDLLSQEEATMRRVSAFFGIDFLPGMLEVARSGVRTLCGCVLVYGMARRCKHKCRPAPPGCSTLTDPDSLSLHTPPLNSRKRRTCPAGRHAGRTTASRPSPPTPPSSSSPSRWRRLRSLSA